MVEALTMSCLAIDQRFRAFVLPHAWPVAARATGHATVGRAQNSQ